MENIHLFEINLIISLQSLGDWAILPMKFFSYLGLEAFYILFFPYIYWCFDTRLAIRAALILFASNAISMTMKILFHLPRPYWIDTRVNAFSHEPSFGFPSGHSQNAASMWGIIAYYLSFQIKRKYMIWAPLGALLIIFLISLSRIYLGVHFISDVIAGWLMGFLLLTMFILGERPFMAFLRKLTTKTQFGLFFILSVSYILITLLLINHLGTWEIPPIWIANAEQAVSGSKIDPLELESTFSIAGIFLGFSAGASWVYRKYGGFDPANNLKQHVIRFAIGITGVLAIWTGLKDIFPISPLGVGLFFRYLRYALLGLWISALSPLLFIHLNLSAPFKNQRES